MDSDQKREGEQVRRAGGWLLVVVILILTGPMLLIAVPAVRGQQVVDQIILLVNGEIVTKSDLLWSIALDPDAPSPEGGISSEILRQKLEVMIDQRLIEQEASRMPGEEVSADVITKARTELIARFSSPEVFQKRSEAAGLTVARINELLRRRLLIEKFVAFRFKSFVFASEEEIQKYYDERLVPEIQKSGRVAPALDAKDEKGVSVHDQIQEIIKQQKINEEIDSFLREAHSRADIVQLAEL
ncbi:MAG TPA: hypothetical protein VJX67_04705 [Blastocatellia bacterium]|nr:hypothetical protein [Blastocatellia bacterium]